MLLKAYEEFSNSDLTDLTAKLFPKLDARSNSSLTIDYAKIADIFCCSESHTRAIFSQKYKMNKSYYKLLEQALKEIPDQS